MLEKINCPRACGECCRVVLITNNHYKSTLQQQWKEERDAPHEFYLAHFREINRKQAIKIKPILGTAKIVWKGIRYFICNLYDYKTNRCKGYNGWRPIMCTKFPMYEHTVLDASWFRAIPECYYINQLMRGES